MGCLVLIALPIVEAIVLWKVGARIGLLATLAALVGAAVLGGALARAEGTRVLRQLQTSLAQGRAPERSIIAGFLVFLGGVFLVFPGFVSDAIGVLLLLAPTRAIIVRLLERRWKHALRAGGVVINLGGFHFGGGGVPGAPPGTTRRHRRPGDDLDDVIDVEAEPIDPPPAAPPRELSAAPPPPQGESAADGHRDAAKKKDDDDAR